MGLKQRLVDDWIILDLDGVFGKIEIKELKEIANSSIENNMTKMSVNFKQIELIDSTGLGALINCHQKFKSVCGKFVLYNLNENIYNLLEMTTVDKMLTIYDSEADLTG